MTANEWIRQKLIENNFSSKIVRAMYSDFIIDTGLGCSQKSFQETVSRINGKMSLPSLMTEDPLKSNPEFRIDLKGKDAEQFVRDYVEVIDNSNEKIINSKSKRIKTLDQLILECGIDLKEWIIESSTVNKWDMPSKSTESGIVELYQVKCRLIKKNPDNQLIPVIQPLNIKVSSSKNLLKKEKNKLKKCLIIPDSQNGYSNENGYLNPFHDRRCWDLVLKLNKEIQPEKIILMGDMLDCAEWSDKFLKSKEFYFTTQASLVELGWLISQLRIDNSEAEIIYLAGNHEERVSKAFITNMVYAYGLTRFDEDSLYPITSVPYMLNLEKIDVRYLGPYPRNSEVFINDNLLAEHGSVVKNESGETVKAILNKTRCSRITGHIHRFEMASKTVYAKRGSIVYTVFSPGTIAKIDGTVPSYSGKENWQQGIAVVNYEDGNGSFNINPIAINDGKMIYNNNIYTGNDSYVEKLIKDTKFKF